MKHALLIAALMALLIVPVAAFAQDSTVVDTVVVVVEDAVPAVDTSAVQDSIATAEFDPESFGLNPAWLALAVAFIVLHVNGVKGFLPGLGSTGVTIVAFAFSGLYIILSLNPGVAFWYWRFIAPGMVSIGAWNTTKIVIAKARGESTPA